MLTAGCYEIQLGLCQSGLYTTQLLSIWDIQVMGYLCVWSSTAISVRTNLKLVDCESVRKWGNFGWWMSVVSFPANLTLHIFCHFCFPTRPTFRSSFRTTIQSTTPPPTPHPRPQRSSDFSRRITPSPQASRLQRSMFCLRGPTLYEDTQR